MGRKNIRFTRYLNDIKLKCSNKIYMERKITSCYRFTTKACSSRFNTATKFLQGKATATCIVRDEIIELYA